MDTLTAILTRRSIRKYTQQAVSDDQVQTILKAAMYAPSAVNKQPWHFIVINDKEKLAQVSQIHKNATMAASAPLAILVCGSELEAHDGLYWTADCAAATMNILLSAHELGLGAVWCGIYPRAQRINDFATLFNLPKQIKPYSIIPIGSPDEQKSMPERFHPHKIHFNQW